MSDAQALSQRPVHREVLGREQPAPLCLGYHLGVVPRDVVYRRETPQDAKRSSSEVPVVGTVSPGGGLVVAGAGPETAMQVADEAGWRGRAAPGGGGRRRRAAGRRSHGSPGLARSEHIAHWSEAAESRRLRMKRAFTVRLRPDATVSGEVPA